MMIPTECDTIPPVERFKWYARKRNRNVTRAEKALIIEMFIYHHVSIIDISKQWGLTSRNVSQIVTLYFKKPEHGLCIMSKI